MRPRKDNGGLCARLGAHGPEQVGAGAADEEDARDAGDDEKDRRRPSPFALGRGGLSVLVTRRRRSRRRPLAVAAAHRRQAKAAAPLLLEAQQVEAVDLRQGAARRLVLEGGA